jgi:uroporphyrinogen decarboxylase
MTPRERVLMALRREEPDKVPMHFVLCPSQIERFRKETGYTCTAEYFGFDIRKIKVGETNFKNDFSKYTAGFPQETLVDEWGIGLLGSSSSKHFRRILHPLQKATRTSEIKDYPYPDIGADYRYSGLSKKVAEFHQQGFAVVGSVAPVGGTVFWPAYKLRGMEELLMDFMTNPAMVETLLNEITDRTVIMASKLAEASVDILRLGDDLGTQSAPLIGPNIFRRYLKPRIRRVIESAKEVKPDLLVFFHSDGCIQEFIPDFIEIGIDILNPVQPECLDPARIKQEYGNQLAFWGTVGTQTTMPFGTPQHIRQIVKERIETVGRGGGFLIAPTHLIEPEVPWENIMTFVEAVHEFGSYQ